MFLSSSGIKQISMICKINEPFKMVQVVLKKSLSADSRRDFSAFAEKSHCQLVFIHREYDGSERFALLYPCGISFEMFPQDKSIVFLI